MRIHRILQLSTVVGISGVLLVVAAFVALQGMDARHAQATLNMNAAVRKISLIRSFLPEQTGASNLDEVRRWQTQLEELKPLLVALPALDEPSRALKTRILEDQVAIASLFDSLVRTDPGGVFNEKRDVIGGQLDVRTASMVSDVLALNDMTFARIKKQRQWVLVVMVASIAVLAALIMALLAIFRRRIVAPILRLEEATGVLSAGKLDQPVPVSGSDEIASLAASVEQMRVSLRARLVEREAAEAEARGAYQQLRETHEQMVQMEKLSALGTLVGGVAHEINNPLMGIKGFIEYAMGKIDAGRPKEVLQRASSEVDRIARIVKNMLVFARSKTTLMTDEVNLAQTARNTVAVVEADLRHQKIEVRVVAPETAVLARCNVDNLQQALLNLLLNARDALKERVLPRTIEVVVGGAEGGRCTITVEDNGPGVPDSIRSKIFDPFFTTKPAGQGTGLGLAVTRQLVEASGGTIEVGAAPAGGARFVITVDSAEKVSA